VENTFRVEACRLHPNAIGERTPRIDGNAKFGMPCRDHEQGRLPLPAVRAQTITANRHQLPYSEAVNTRTWKAWLVPGRAIGAGATLVNSSLFLQIAPSLSFYYVAVFAAGLLLACVSIPAAFCFPCCSAVGASRRRFLLRRTTSLRPRSHRHCPGRFAHPAQPRRLRPNARTRPDRCRYRTRFGLLFVESVAFAVLCRPETVREMQPPIPIIPRRSDPALDSVDLHSRHRRVRPPFLSNPQAHRARIRLVHSRRFPVAPIRPARQNVDAYVATAALILAASLIETSYVLAYHDELTGIRGRRAFNESLLSLDSNTLSPSSTSTISKKFNDTYGHDTGDQVLCMVAKRLSDVGGDARPSAAEAKSSPSSSATLPLKKPSIILKPSAKTSKQSTSTSVARIEEPSAPKRRAATADRPIRSQESPQEKKAAAAPRRRSTTYPLPSASESPSPAPATVNPSRSSKPPIRPSIAPSTKAETAWNQPPPHSSA